MLPCFYQLLKREAISDNFAVLQISLLEAGKLKLKVLVDLGSGEVLPPNLQVATFSLYPALAENRESVDINLLHKGLIHMTYELSKAWPSDVITLVIGSCIGYRGGVTNIQSTTFISMKKCTAVLDFVRSECFLEFKRA